FGEELFAGTGGRTFAQGYAVGDGLRQQFTSKERDVETGLDYFLARYYSSLQGRFTSPDEFTGGPDELYNFADDASDNPTFYAELANPQSLNKYQYTYNNPINLTDPDGHCPPCLAAAAAVAITILMSPDTTHAPTGNETKPLTRSGDGIQRAVAVGMASRGALRAVEAVESARSSAAAERKARQGETDKLARKVADEAQASGVTSGAGGASIAKTGERFTALAGESKLHPIVQKIYDSVPKKLREAPYHSKCCEGNTTTQMINAGVNPRGATHSVVRIRKPADPKHGTPLPPCSSCAHLFKRIDRIFQ
ncbi:MAG TPA: RHS repeat-associated core domain-containing protein, partial [Candidatus Saccharimonadales bacterium]|nr:RHS repeat-associated core domain-containing protein [Candidatus Saccharimonadales bacterium]